MIEGNLLNNSHPLTSSAVWKCIPEAFFSSCNLISNDLSFKYHTFLLALVIGYPLPPKDD
jgi:hypothetical protein